AEALLEDRMLLSETVQRLKTKLDAEKDAVKKKLLQDAETKLGKLQKHSRSLTRELEVASAEEARSATALDRKQTEYGQTIQRLAKVGDGIAAIGTGVATLMSPVSTSDKEVQELAMKVLESEKKVEYQGLLKDARDLSARLAQAMAKFQRGQ